MFKIEQFDGIRTLLSFAFLALLVAKGPLALAQTQSDQPNAPDGTVGLWDPARYISIAEVKPGMEAYCLTEYGRAGIEKFGLEIIDVVPDFDPGRTVILVQGTDERFIHTGIVAGCSGSPVYIEGRLAGALAYGWQFGKDALYGVTAIEDMLRIGTGSEDSEQQVALAYDFSKPINLAEVEKQATKYQASIARGVMGATALPCPLVTSGLSVEACRRLEAAVGPLGLVVVPGSSGRMATMVQGGQEQTQEEAIERKLEPGACLAVPLVSGDINIGTYGTVTEVRGDKVYGFGHPFLGYGPLDLPMATGRVHTVISSMMRSSKMCSVDQIVGALRTDEGAGILGQVGVEAKTVPLTIRVDRFNDTKERTYKCNVAINRSMTPSMIGSAISGAALYLGDLPSDHTIEYEANIDLEGYEPISFKNISSAQSINELLTDSIATVRLLLNNPYKQVDLKSIDVDVCIKAKSIVSQIWSVDLSDSKVKAGETVDITVVVETVREGKKKYQMPLEIPRDLKPGRYELAVCGSQDYEQFLAKVVPYRFVALNVSDLVSALRQMLQIDRNGLYFILSLPSGGVTVEKSELPDLPATKALVLQSAKRATSIRPYPHWIEKSLKTGTVVVDKRVLRITVEK